MIDNEIRKELFEFDRNMNDIKLGMILSRQDIVDQTLSAIKKIVVESLPQVTFRKYPSDYEQGFDDGRDQAIADMRKLYEE